MWLHGLLLSMHLFSTLSCRTNAEAGPWEASHLICQVLHGKFSVTLLALDPSTDASEANWIFLL